LSEFATTEDPADLDVSPDGRTIAAGISDGSVLLLHLDGNRLVLDRALATGEQQRADVQPLSIDEYLSLHGLLLQPSLQPDWGRQVAQLGLRGDRFTLHLLQQIDQTRLAAPQRELVKRITDKLKAETAFDAAGAIPASEIARFLELAAVADLRCSPLEHVMPAWVQATLKAQRDDEDTRTELARLQREFQPQVSDQQAWGSVRDRVSRYLASIRASPQGPE
jgi:hypothetical protein